MRVAPQNYGFINTLRNIEQATIRNQQNIKNLEKMNRETIQSVESRRETDRIENTKFDRIRQAREAYLGNELQKLGHNETIYRVDVKV
jgi:hypothetical protein